MYECGRWKSRVQSVGAEDGVLEMFPTEGALAHCSDVGVSWGQSPVAVSFPWGDAATEGKVELAVETYMRVARVLRLDDAYFYLPEAEALPVDPRNEAMCLWDLRSHVEAHGTNDAPEATRILQAVGRRENALSDEIDGAPVRCIGGGHRNDAKMEDGRGSAPQGAPGADRVERLARWADQRGLQLAPGVSVGPTGPEQLGLIARDGVRTGVTVVEVPRRCLIHAGTAMQTDLGKLLAQVGHVDSENILLLWLMRERARALMHERGEKLLVQDVDVVGGVDRPDWGPYLASLPARYDTMLSADESVFDALAGTMAEGVARNAHAHVRAAYQALDVPGLSAAFPDAFSPANAFTEDQYVWAVETCYSRGLQVEGLSNATPRGHIGSGGRDDAGEDEGEGERKQEAATCLVPVADMINHSPAAHIWAYGRLDAESGSLKFRATRPVAAARADSDQGNAGGVEVTLGYGSLSNTDLLVFYGFSVTNNPHDYFAVTIDLDEAEDAGRKRALLALFGVEDPENHRLRKPPAVSIGRVGALSPSLIATLQVMLMDPRQLGRVERAAPKALAKAAAGRGPSTSVHVLRELLHAQGIRRWGALRVVADLAEALLANLPPPASASSAVPRDHASGHAAQVLRYCNEQRATLRAALAEAQTGDITPTS